MTAVPTGDCRPFRVNTPPTLCMRMPCTSAFTASSAAADPQGIRYPTFPGANVRVAGGAS